ncbi:MAG TPA: PQQ-binding-like beta-propeller repeat protein, partial [Gemmataceae bacterium]|nr:PQQ-binding-like beta-propeller repeat protein [Gemmataceae bacterium]
WYTPPTVPDDAPVVFVTAKGKKRDWLRSRNWYFGRTGSSVTIREGLVYASDYHGFVFCFDAGTGKLYWYEDLKQSIWGQPLWADGKVFFTTDGGEIVIFAHGKEKNQLARIECDASIHAGIIYANSILYVAADNRLYAIRSPK